MTLFLWCIIQEDSGGPLLTLKSAGFSQLRIVSYGLGCAVPDTPAVYTRFSAYKEWIADTIWEVSSYSPSSCRKSSSSSSSSSSISSGKGGNMKRSGKKKKSSKRK